MKWLDELLTALNLATVRLMGHSYGGWLATLFALAHTERVEKLVLLSLAATVLPPPPGLLLRAILYHRLPFRCVTKRYMYWYAPDAVRNVETCAAIDKIIREDLLAKRCFKRQRLLGTRLHPDHSASKHPRSRTLDRYSDEAEHIP